MRLRKPCPDLLISLLALFVALGGSSYAALALPKASVGAKQLKKNAVTSPKVKPGSLLLSDFRASQRAGLVGPGGSARTAGTKGRQGGPGDPGSARAYAYINTDGTLDAARSKNVTASRLQGGFTGVYCIDVAFTPQNAVATSDADTATIVRADTTSASTVCDDVDVRVNTWNHDGVLANRAFFIAFN